MLWGEPFEVMLYLGRTMSGRTRVSLVALCEE